MAFTVVVAVTPAGVAGATDAAKSHAPAISDRAGPSSSPRPAVISPLANQPQAEANRPIPVPDTRSCTETLMYQHQFGSSYGHPFLGTYHPTKCAAPWSVIVLTFSSSVAGDQYDRTVDVTIGGAETYLGTTSEPCCTGNSVSWSVQQTVTEDAALFTTSQPVVVELDNVNTSTYTGVYDSTLTVTFYETGKGAPAAVAPAAVFGIDPQATNPATPTSFDGTLYSLGTVGQLAGRDVTFPRNLARLDADLWAEGQGPCEEFWWSEPSDCGVGTPYREVAIYIDGILAGAAPVYPTTFTGADGPGLWEPIPSPRAWDLRPYRVDLTPFVGLLTDGHPHLVQLGISDAAYTSGDFWNVAATLLAWTQKYSKVTKGALTAIGVPTISETQSTDPTGEDVEATDTVSTSRTWAGWILADNHKRVTHTVTEKVQMSSTEAAEAVDDTWTWDRQSSIVTGGKQTDYTNAASFSIADASLAHFEFTDDNAFSKLVDGAATTTKRVAESMTTTDASGLAYNGSETESYGYANTAGVCYDQTLDAAAGQEVEDAYPSSCPSTTPVAALSPGQSTPYGPPPDVPEAPAAGLLLAVGATAGFAVLRWRRRRPPLAIR